MRRKDASNAVKDATSTGRLEYAVGYQQAKIEDQLSRVAEGLGIDAAELTARVAELLLRTSVRARMGNSEPVSRVQRNPAKPRRKQRASKAVDARAHGKPHSKRNGKRRKARKGWWTGLTKDQLKAEMKRRKELGESRKAA